MENQEQLNLNSTEVEYTYAANGQLLYKQDYLDYIDADMEAFYSIKIDAVGFDVTGL